MSMFAGDLSSKYLRQGYGMPTSSLRNQPTQAGMGVSSAIKQPLRNTGGGGLPNFRETSAYKQGLTRNIDQNMGGYVNPSLYSDPNLGQPNPYQTNVDWMNQMAQKNAQVGSDGSSIFPTFSYDTKTNQYMRDSSAFGLTGDAANTYYSPEDFQFELWFVRFLKPFVHYIPLAHGASNLSETVRWVLKDSLESSRLRTRGHHCH